MSRIGKMPIALDSKVKVALQGTLVSIEGPRGKLRQDLPRGISVDLEDKQVLVQRRDDSKEQRSLHGLMRTLLANAIHGVNQGFEKKLEIHGVGYSAEVKGSDVHLKLGYSHPVVFAIPEGIAVKVERNVMTVSGCDIQQVGQVSADLRKLRPPDVYKQKGIRYQDERLRKKAGKAGA